MELSAGLASLRQQFLNNEAAYRSPGYNEAQARLELIDPLLEHLGWDVANRSHKPLHLRDVISEDVLRVRDRNATAPDYSLNRGGVRSLFVEAKQPAKKLSRDKSAAFQLRRYGWSGGLGLSVLTNFAEFAIYDCRVPPAPNDSAARARLLYTTIDDLETHWSDIYSLVSKDAVYSGSLERFAVRQSRGRSPVDETFLSSLRDWRLSLAASMKRLNQDLSERELNYLVTKTIDRIVFLRIAEDRGIEPKDSLHRIAEDENPSDALAKALRAADERYNSGLFHFREEAGRPGQADSLSLGITFDSDLLRKQLLSLYFPENPFEFSVISAEILGKAYEQFLGETIAVEPDGTVSTHPKPEIRKAGGVFYTPDHVVRYCIAHTLEAALADEGVTPRSRPTLRILDPACGSGGFLIQAYQSLLNWYLQKYVDLGPERFPNRLRQIAPSTWILSISERKRILLDHIFGVDIDEQAVETTKLSLLLKVLEGENSDTIGAQLRLFHERALPDLSNNIRCGNSLVSDDMFLLLGDAEFPEPAIGRVNPFNFEQEFPDIMKSGGFDVVVGNPPYVFGEFHNAATKQYLLNTFSLAAEQFDTYWLFIERAIHLLKGSGRLAYVLPDSILARSEPGPVRRLLLANGLSRIYHCGLVFDVGVSAVVIVARPGTSSPRIEAEERQGDVPVSLGSRDVGRFHRDQEFKFLIHASDQDAKVLDRIEASSIPLAQLADLSRGEEAGKRSLSAVGIPILVGEDVSAHHIQPASYHVSSVKKSPANYLGPKVLLVKTGSTSVAAVDESDSVTLQSLYNIHVTSSDVSEYALCSILNSRPMHWYIHKTFTAYKLLFPQMNQSTVLALPIPTGDSDFYALLDSIGRSLAQLTSDRHQASVSEDRIRIDRHISVLSAKLDDAILDAWGLDEVERRLVSSLDRE